VLRMDKGVIGNPYGAGSVMGATPLDVLDISAFKRDEVEARVSCFRGLFFGGSFCNLMLLIESDVASDTFSSVVFWLLLLTLSLSMESTSIKTSSSSLSCTTDVGVSLYPCPLTPALDVLSFCSDSHHLAKPRFLTGTGAED